MNSSSLRNIILIYFLPVQIHTNRIVVALEQIGLAHWPGSLKKLPPTIISRYVSVWQCQRGLESLLDSWVQLGISRLLKPNAIFEQLTNIWIVFVHCPSMWIYKVTPFSSCANWANVVFSMGLRQFSPYRPSPRSQLHLGARVITPPTAER